MIDNTAVDKTDTLAGSPLSKYRLTHWMIDILRNFFADPVNIRDTRISRALTRADGTINSNNIVYVDTPYGQDSRFAGTTPAILVCAGDTQYPAGALDTGRTLNNGTAGSETVLKFNVFRVIGGTISVIAESCDGAVQLASLIEDFLVMNRCNFLYDGFLSDFKVTGSSAPQHIQAGSAANAKDLYQVTISVMAAGSICWTSDTQGPVFRGMSII